MREGSRSEGIGEEVGDEEMGIPSGAIHAGQYIRPGHWKENFASAMLILAVMSSSICQSITRSAMSYGGKNPVLNMNNGPL